MGSDGQTIADLRVRAEKLEQQIESLTLRAGGGYDELMKKWGLNYGQARILGALADGRVYSIEDLATLGAKTGDGKPGSARSDLHRIRKKIGPVEIRSIYGRGHRLDEPHLSTVLAVMGGRA